MTDAGAGTQVVGDYVLHEKLGQGGAWEPYHLFVGPQMVVVIDCKLYGKSREILLGKSRLGEGEVFFHQRPGPLKSNMT